MAGEEPQQHHESLTEQIEHGDIDSIDTNARYLAYGARLRTALTASSRYLAYTSDVGEAFRPIVSPLVVKAAYGISWAYLGLDVSYEGYKAVQAGKDNATVATMVVKRGVFQSLASMAFPMLTIHSLVKYSAKTIFANVKNAKVKGWGPTFMGLGILPFLPYMFDHPVETAVDKIFEPVEKYVLQKKVPHVAHETVEEEKKTQ
ncbi:mitochondrial 18 KDa protein-domain-containing protein [Zychaea mexicana]|uniref:mitochondrial 18 KDa protein-domain-containing protein n=1 Tax=Zychaea mexicana TaxID=64656 RepID=UPI0022FE3DA8|nr:mitochondrial 18 KDa protein-domain-containing protein [Zychaea mexicana]KAI9474885.1 mitochondrial 18 KDa protein-domain-containing protein [Zychaea mexicana]